MQEKWSVANGHWEIPHSSIRAVCFNCILSPPESLTGGNKLKVPNSYSSEGISERVHDLNAEALKPSFAIIRSIFNLYNREVFLQSYHEEDFKRLCEMGLKKYCSGNKQCSFSFSLPLCKTCTLFSSCKSLLSEEGRKRVFEISAEKTIH